MKRFLAIFALVFAMTFSAFAGIRAAYRTSSGVTHVLTDYVKMDGQAVPFWMATELIGFPDGSTAYLLYINYEEKSVRNIPKGVKMAATLQGGKILRFDQMAVDNPTRQAFVNSKGERVYWNHTKYLVESPEMEKLVRGVKSLDVITGWDPDDYIQLNFPGDEFSATLNQQCTDIYEATPGVKDLSGEIGSYSDGTNSLIITAKPIPAKGGKLSFNPCLTYLYYKTTNTEDFDISFMIGSDSVYHIQYDAPVRLTLGDGSAIELKQTRDEDNFVYVYPSLEDIRAIMSKGIASISIGLGEGFLEDSFEGDPFGESIKAQYNQIMSIVSIL